MGYKPWEIDQVLYKDFNLILTGYYRKQERDANIARNIMFYIKHFGGLGNPDKDTPRDIWPLNLDTEDEKRMIINLKMAQELLKEF